MKPNRIDPNPLSYSMAVDNYFLSEDLSNSLTNHESSSFMDVSSDITEEETQTDYEELSSSYRGSYITAETPPDPFINMHSRSRQRWVEDRNAPKCSACNEKFGYFFRRHHCIAEGTLITLPTGISRPIETIIAGTRLPAYDMKSKNIDINKPVVDAVMNQGMAPCLRIVLEDERELIATSDHRILTSDENGPKYVYMKDLKEGDKIVCSALPQSPKFKSIEENLRFVHSKLNYPSFEEFLLACEWNGTYTLNLKIVEGPLPYKNSEPIRVFDLSVPEYTSFVANGMVVHNCRSCGQVFCSECSRYKNSIPECITSIPTQNGLTKDINHKERVRLCYDCNQKILRIRELEAMLGAFQLVELDMKDFKKIACVCRLWRQLSNFYLSKFREIQYKLPYQAYTDWEKNSLWNNRQYLMNHDVWVTHLIRSHKFDENRLSEIMELYQARPIGIPKNPRQCWTRMCTRLCNPKMSIENSLLLLFDATDESTVNTKPITDIIVQAFDKCDNTILECYLSFIMDKIISTDNVWLINFIFNRSQESIRIANSVYWVLKIHSSNMSRKNIKERGKCERLINKLFKMLPQDFITTILNCTHLSKILEKTDNLDQLASIFRENGNIVSPVKPDLGEQEVITDKLSVKKSATRPIVIPLKSGESFSRILYKSEDLRKDQVIMSIIRIMKDILFRALDIDLNIITYNIQPTSLDGGFIEMVPDCTTLYDITENKHVTLLNYMINHNPKCTVETIRKRFIRSCAAYSVITFLLGLGDRHLDNILLTNKGEMFHIDYGFVLGQDPKPVKTPSMRITSGMLDAIGGYHSESYQEFKDLAENIYEILRRHVNTFVCLLSLLPKHSGSQTNPRISEKRLLREVAKRFAPGESHDKARNILCTRIDNSTNTTTLSKYHVIDFFHRHNKERTVKNIMTFTLSTTVSGTRNLLSGIWEYMKY